MKRFLWRFLRMQQAGLILVILLLSALLACRVPSTFLTPITIMQWMTDSVFYAIMAVGVTMVIISGGIDLSVGAIYALAGITMAMVFGAVGPMGTVPTLFVAVVLSSGIGALCGLVNGLMVVGLRVHPFIITMGTMLVFRGIASVASEANSIPVPDQLTAFIKNPLGLGSSLYPVPTIIMLLVVLTGEVFLLKTVMGRNIFAIGGNAEAARYCGLRMNWSLVGVFAISGLTAGIAALVAAGYFGSASCSDGSGYELYVIASAVVGGASLMGGKGSASSAMLGAILIALIGQSIGLLGIDQNYEAIIIGCAIVAAVVLDRLSAQVSARRMLSKSAKKIEVTTNDGAN